MTIFSWTKSTKIRIGINETPMILSMLIYIFNCFSATSFVLKINPEKKITITLYKYNAVIPIIKSNKKDCPFVI